MSALPPNADIAERCHPLRFVPSKLVSGAADAIAAMAAPGIAGRPRRIEKNKSEIDDALFGLLSRSRDILLDAVDGSLSNRCSPRKLCLAPPQDCPACSDFSSELHSVGHFALRPRCSLATL